MATKYRPGPDGQWRFEWIDKEARVGPIFRIGPDVYSRVREDGRVLQNDAILSPGMNYLNAAVEAFKQTAEQWQAPIVYIINPDVRKPPAVRFLYQWSQTAFHNGSVERSYMLTSNFFTQKLGQFVLRAFTSDMPFDPIQGQRRLDSALDAMDLSCGREGFELKGAGTALAVVGGPSEEDTAFTQLFRRLRRRVRGR